MRAFSALSNKRLCIGAGSNVVDLFFPVRKLPSPGDKQYFSHEQLVSSQVVGGVTLNHLCWARELGVPTALLALQGLDANGEKVRAKLASLGVGTGLIRASADFTTSVSYILSEEGGERTILMNPASTSRMTCDLMARDREWAKAIALSGMVTTEISQLPLSGVEWLLRSARTLGAPSVLDVDVPPSVATGSARLGTAEELQRCVRSADVVKVTGGAVEELLSLLAPGVRVEPSLEGVTQQLADVLGCRLAVITDGSRGSALAASRAAGGGGVAVRVPCFAGVTQVDATGAGDAYLGGLIAALWHLDSAGRLPATDAQLMHAGRIASAAGAACVEVVGALPEGGVSAARLAALCPEVAPLLAAARELPTGASGSGSGSASASASASVPAPAGSPAYSAFLASLQADAAALEELDPPSAAAVEAAVAALASCRGPAGRSGHRHSSTNMCWTTGMGKAGAVAARAAMSLKSLGYRSAHTPAAEWAHGDLGCIAPGDVVLAFSHSGRTPEVLGALEACKERGARVIAITGSRDGPLALAADVVLEAAAAGELLGAVPTRSVVAQEAVVNALLSACVADRRITARHFKANHPGGAIGGKAQ